MPGGPRRLASRIARRLARFADPSGELARRIAPAEAGPAVLLDDPRSIAQVRAASHLLAHLDASATQRAAVQARRRRSDRELFERFPLHLVPTYPGDAELFASPGFRSWLPPGLPLVEASLGELMEMGG